MPYQSLPRVRAYRPRLLFPIAVHNSFAARTLVRSLAPFTRSHERRLSTRLSTLDSRLVAMTRVLVSALLLVHLTSSSFADVSWENISATSVCTSCEAGKYQNQKAQTGCKACLAGRYANVAGTALLGTPSGAPTCEWLTVTEEMITTVTYGGVPITTLSTDSGGGVRISVDSKGSGCSQHSATHFVAVGGATNGADSLQTGLWGWHVVLGYPWQGFGLKH